MNRINIKDSKAFLLAKARSKYISSNLARQLVKLESNLHKQYRNTFACCNNISIEDGEFKSLFYCKNRWCLNCQRQKMAIIIDKYKPQLEVLEDLHFVTLTAPTCREDQLKDQIQIFQTRWRKITDLGRKKIPGFKGVRKSECKAKYRGSHYEYHYHYHILVQGKEAALYLVEKWLELSPYSSRSAQDMRKVDNMESGVLELFKYFTKLTTSDNAGNEISTPARYLDVIFTAMKGKRVYQPFGGLKAVSEDDIEIEHKKVIAQDGIYEWYGQDWYNVSFGHHLTGYEPDIEDGKLWRNR